MSLTGPCVEVKQFSNQSSRITIGHRREPLGLPIHQRSSNGKTIRWQVVRPHPYTLTEFAKPEVQTRPSQSRPIRRASGAGGNNSKLPFALPGHDCRLQPCLLTLVSLEQVADEFIGATINTGEFAAIDHARQCDPCGAGLNTEFLRERHQQSTRKARWDGSEESRGNDAAGRERGHSQPSLRQSLPMKFQ